jgi:hypothetical protein
MEVHPAVLELYHVDRHIDRRTDSRKYMVILIDAFLQVFLANAPKAIFQAYGYRSCTRSPKFGGSAYTNFRLFKDAVSATYILWPLIWFKNKQEVLRRIVLQSSFNTTRIA